MLERLRFCLRLGAGRILGAIGASLNTEEMAMSKSRGLINGWNTRRALWLPRLAFGKGGQLRG